MIEPFVTGATNGGWSLPGVMQAQVGASKKKGDSMNLSPRSQVRVLVVEDDSTFSGILCDILSQPGEPPMVPSAETSIASALVAMARERIDVVLLDLKLPNGQGLETISRIMSSPPAPPCVVVLTAGATDEERMLAYREGVQEYVSKTDVAQRGAPYLREIVLRALNRQHGFRRKYLALSRLLGRDILEGTSLRLHP